MSITERQTCSSSSSSSSSSLDQQGQQRYQVAGASSLQSNRIIHNRSGWVFPAGGGGVTMGRLLLISSDLLFVSLSYLGACLAAVKRLINTYDNQPMTK